MALTKPETITIWTTTNKTELIKGFMEEHPDEFHTYCTKEYEKQLENYTGLT